MNSDLVAFGHLLRARLPLDRSTGGWFRRFPVSIGLISLIAAIGVLTGHASEARFADELDMFGLAYHDVQTGAFWHLFTGSLIQSDRGIAWSMALLLVCALLPLEYLAGSWRLAVTFFVSDWIGSLGMVIGLRLLAGLQIADAASRLVQHDAGSSAAAHGCLAAAIMLLPRRLAMAGFVIILAISSALLFQQEIDAAIAHLVAVLVGGDLGWFVWRPAMTAAPDSDRSLTVNA